MEKNQRLWREVMLGEAGLNRLHEKFFEVISNQEITKTQIELILQGCRSEMSIDDATNYHDSIGLNGVGLEQASQYISIFLPERGISKPMFICITELDDIDEARRLIETASVLTRHSTKILESDDFSEWNKENLSFEKQVAYAGSLDLDSPKYVLLDNIQTTADVFRVVSHGTRSLEYDLRNFSALTDTDMVNQLTNETQLQQCGRAPFGFWAQTRKVMPVSYNGVSVIAENGGFTEEFLEALRTGKSETETAYGLQDDNRHGGCPALHKDTKRLDHINRMGKLFTEWHKLIHE